MNSSLKRCFRALPEEGTVLDVGCLGFRQVEHGRALGLKLAHAGVDRLAAPEPLPPEFIYKRADLEREPIPFEDDRFDLVVASHVIEHVRNPLDVVAECVRVCRPGGRIYIEAPSERSLWLPGMPWWHEDLRSLSFFDDPTHVGRPWTPQALHRLARYLGCEPEEARHLTSYKLLIGLPFLVIGALVKRRSDILEWAVWGAIGWAAAAVIRKPPGLRGGPAVTYFTTSPDAGFGE